MQVQQYQTDFLCRGGVALLLPFFGGGGRRCCCCSCSEEEEAGVVAVVALSFLPPRNGLGKRDRARPGHCWGVVDPFISSSPAECSLPVAALSSSSTSVSVDSHVSYGGGEGDVGNSSTTWSRMRWKPLGTSLSNGNHESIVSPFLKCKSSIWLNRSSQASNPLFFNVTISWQKPHQKPHWPFRPIRLLFVWARIYSSSLMWWWSFKWAWNCSRRWTTLAHCPILLVRLTSRHRHASIW